MPGVQFQSSGATGTGHGIDYYLSDPERLCINGIKAQLLVAEKLLKDDAACAKAIIAQYKPRYASIEEFFEDISDFDMEKEAVTYCEDGSVKIEYQK